VNRGGRGPVAATGVRGRKRERDRVAVGHRHVDPGGTVPGGAVQTGFETKIRIQMVQNIFKPFQTLVDYKSTFLYSEKREEQLSL
jgi:hypothetical protein